jgi:hypothetical protein
MDIVEYCWTNNDLYVLKGACKDQIINILYTLDSASLLVKLKLSQEYSSG